MSKSSLRGQYGKTLLDLGRSREDLMVMDADLAKSTKTLTFAKEIKDRFIDMGLSEQDMISTAAGLSLTGKTVFASSFCVFLIGRAFDQVRQSVCYNQANVKLVGTHSGLGVGEDGATHQTLEDVALTRTLPNLRVIVPADARETDFTIRYAADTPGPFFIRLTRQDLPDLHPEGHVFTPGKGSVIRDGEQVTLVAMGAMVHVALAAADILARDHNIPAAVINMSAIKPLDSDLLMQFARKSKGFVTAEDHSVYGGLGGAVAEWAAQHHPLPMRMVGMKDQFGRSGVPEDLYEHFGLNAARIVAEARSIL
jgi:transketolase